ncbi:SDR family NAD(P)-dependent oxidoreductase [Streptomyces sp. NBC_00076]|uniref:SDR family NAD(P)-dependent oxidoreductase n=1 Tax=Streptomyces sp. NBC_00076 TaxID=2975642 RepID=UPI00324A1156
MARFADRVVIVTGAGAPDGIGAAVAKGLVAEGARVVLGATSERVHQRAAEVGPAAVGVIADLTIDGASDALVQAAMDRWGRVDVLVNNAGMTSVASGWDAGDDVAELSLADGVTVNVVAPGYVATGSQLEFEAAAAAAGPIGRSATPDEIAACVMFLAHESASFVTGSALVADGGHGLPETWPRP